VQELRGTTAIVTGASRGIGVYIATALAKEGVNLVLAARSLDDLEKVRADMQALGVKALAVKCDVSSADDRAELVRRAEAEMGPVDLLINNAGVERVARFATMAPADIVETLNVNLEAPMLLSQLVLPGMLARGRGHIVNIASGAGKVGVPMGTSYCASKHGLVGFTHALHAELRRSPVGASVVCPAFVADAGMYARWEAQGIRSPMIAGTAKPEAVAKAVLRCIRKNKVEATVNTPPVRPLIVLANIAPSMVAPLLEKIGYSQVFERAAEATADVRLTG
jgi:short-subunit dehydrogenase